MIARVEGHEPRSAPPGLLARLRAVVREGRRLDVAFGAIGLGFASVSLALPFGRDQGLYAFVAREWWKNGEMPYRDAFEQKTPGIYLVHALAMALFGEHMGSIRILELGCLVALGLVCARLATPARQPVPHGIYGVGMLAAAVTYVGFFDFWDTAQCEIWCTTLAMAAACAVLRIERDLHAAAVGGVLAGVALVFKPPALPLVLLAGGALAARAWRTPAGRPGRVARSMLVFGIAASAPSAIVVAYFAAKGALPDMADVLLGSNAYYVARETGVHSLFDVAQQTHNVYKLGEPVSSLCLEGLVVAIVVGFVRRDRVLRDRHLFALAACVAGFLGVLSQLKFYMYHWGLVVGPATLVTTNLALDALALGRWRMPSRGPSIALACFALNLLAAYALTGRAANQWLEEVTATGAWLSGTIDREEFARQFQVGALGFELHGAEAVAGWLREHTSPSDEVAVRGFEPEIYVLAHRRYGGRFFWTSYLTDPRRAYRREEWLAQDRAQLEARKPRWVVADARAHAGPDATDYFTPMGYVVRSEIAGYAVMERNGAGTP